VAARQRGLTPRRNAAVAPTEPSPTALPNVGGAGGPPAPAPRDLALPRSYYRSPAGEFRRDLKPKELLEVITSGVGDLWVDVDSTQRHQHAVLEKIFNFHPLAIEDTLNPANRGKLEDYGGYLFAVVRGVKFQDETDDPYDIATYNQYFFLGKNYLVTVHAEPSPSIGEIAKRVERTPDVLSRGPGRVMHSVMDAEIDAFFPILDQIDEFVDGLEERVFVEFDETAIRDIFSVKRLVLGLKRHLTPQREVFNIITNRPSALLAPETQIYFRDVYDHVLRITDSLDTYRELLSSTLDSYLSQVSNRLGKVTKGLSAVATLSIPFVVVSGMWGMNFGTIPLAGNPLGFWIMLVAQLAMGIALVLLLKVFKLL
jgi:magnesium transporter